MAFNLEALLKLRRIQEDDQLKKFAETNAHLLKQKDQLRVVGEVKQKNFKSQDNEMRKNPNANQLWLYNQFFEGSHYQGKKSNLILAEVEKSLSVRRKDLAEAMRKRKALELLKEKETEKFRKIKVKKEQDILDESATNLWTIANI